jgi:hypothetical protein
VLDPPEFTCDTLPDRPGAYASCACPRESMGERRKLCSSASPNCSQHVFTAYTFASDRSLVAWTSVLSPLMLRSIHWYLMFLAAWWSRVPLGERASSVGASGMVRQDEIDLDLSALLLKNEVSVSECAEASRSPIATCRHCRVFECDRVYLTESCGPRIAPMIRRMRSPHVRGSCAFRRSSPGRCRHLVTLNARPRCDLRPVQPARLRAWTSSLLAAPSPSPLCWFVLRLGRPTWCRSLFAPYRFAARGTPAVT